MAAADDWTEPASGYSLGHLRVIARDWALRTLGANERRMQGLVENGPAAFRYVGPDSCRHARFRL